MQFLCPWSGALSPCSTEENRLSISPLPPPRLSALTAGPPLFLRSPSWAGSSGCALTSLLGSHTPSHNALTVAHAPALPAHNTITVLPVLHRPAILQGPASPDTACHTLLSFIPLAFTAAQLGRTHHKMLSLRHLYVAFIWPPLCSFHLATFM